MPTYRCSSNVVVTSSTAMAIPKPTSPNPMVDGDWIYLLVAHRASVTVSAVPAGFTLLPEASALSGGTTAANVRLSVYGKEVEDAASEPSTYAFTMSANMFGVGMAVAVGDLDGAQPVDIALASPDADANNSVASPSVLTTSANDLLLRAAFMNNPSAGFAANDFAPADATRVQSPAITSGTQRVSGGLAYEAGPSTPSASGTELWTVAGAVFGPAVGLTMAFRGVSLTAVAGNDQTVTPGAFVTLDATDTEGYETLVWELVDGTYNMDHFRQVNGVATFYAPAGPTTLTFEVTATAGEASGTDTVSVFVAEGATNTLKVGVLGVDGHSGIT